MGTFEEEEEELAWRTYSCYELSPAVLDGLLFVNKKMNFAPQCCRAVTDQYSIYRSKKIGYSTGKQTLPPHC